MLSLVGRFNSNTAHLSSKHQKFFLTAVWRILMFEFCRAYLEKQKGNVIIYHIWKGKENINKI